MDKLEKTEIKIVKFTNQQINAFFDLINDSKTEKLIGLNPGTEGRIIKINGLKSFKDPSRIRAKLTEPKVNAYVCFDAGSTFDNISVLKQDDSKVKSKEERIADVQKRLDELVKHLQEVLNKSKDFSNIQVKVMNKELTLCITSTDRGDDGNDYFGVDVFLKFSYK